MQSSRTWLLSQHRIGSSQIAVACQWSCLPPPYTLSSAAACLRASSLANMRLALVALVLTSCNRYCSQCWKNVSRSLPLEGVTWRILRSNRSIAFWRSASNQVVATCQAIFRSTWNRLHFVVETISAPYRRASIAAQILWIFCSHNRWNFLANRSSTWAFADFDSFFSRTIPFFWEHCSSASSSALRDRSEWFCWLTSRENWHNAQTAPITISSKTVLAAVFRSSLELNESARTLLPVVWSFLRSLYLAQCRLSINQMASRSTGGWDIEAPMWIDCQIDPWHF
jgi:hypothetical protein